MVRDKVIDYMESEKDGMSESHLGCWFNGEYFGKRTDDIRSHIDIDHDTCGTLQRGIC